VTAVGGLSPVVAVAFAYAIGLDRMWQRVGRGRLVSPTRAVLFLLGLAVTGVALGPPLDGTVETSFTAHMTQHVLLIWISAPLLVAGSPMPVLLWALPDRYRLAAQRRWRTVHRSVAGPAWPMWVAATAAVQAVVLAVWHLPVLYQAALDNSLVHAAEHASFLFSAMAFWWTIAGAVRRSRFGAGVLAVFVAKLPGLFLGVGLTLATRVWYPHYGTGAGAVHDQQAAGVVMWVGGGMVATIAALVLFGLWMQALERATPPHEAAPQPVKAGA
jgi:cytochrome c oxidase assembly factor CtaG